MKNIEYLEHFFRKHHLKGQVKVKYTGVLEKDDDYMSEITFEDGNTVSINDIIFDTDSQLDPDVGDQWLEEHKESGISFKDWILEGHYLPRNIDRSSFEEYKKEMEGIMENVKETISKIFELEPDENEKSEE